MSIVDVFVSNGQAMIWNPNDAVKLRKDHRIIATPVGSLPRNSKQNVCLGLPLLLMPEQATLLAEKNLVRLRSYRMPPKASQEQVDFFEKEREESVKQQAQLWLADQDIRRQQYISSIASASPQSKLSKSEKKKIKLAKKKQEKKQLMDIKPQNEAATTTTKCDNTSVVNVPADVVMKQETIRASDESVKQHDVISLDEEETSDGDYDTLEPCAKRPRLDDDNNIEDEIQASDLVVSDRVEASRDLVCDQSERKDGSLDVQISSPTIQITRADPRAHTYSLDSCPEWEFPKTKREKIKYIIYKDLWEKGYYVANGAKFGGDYLIYPGDLALVHSHYVAIIKEWDERMSAFEIISSGRLGTKVKKNALFCSVDNDGMPVYYSAQWTGIV